MNNAPIMVRMRPSFPRGVHPDRDIEGIGLVGVSGRRTAGGPAGGAVRSGGRQGRSVDGNGAPRGEGMRRQHGHVAAHADAARQLHNAAAHGGFLGGEDHHRGPTLIGHRHWGVQCTILVTFEILGNLGDRHGLAHGLVTV